LLKNHWGIFQNWNQLGNLLEILEPIFTLKILSFLMKKGRMNFGPNFGWSSLVLARVRFNLRIN